MNSILSQVLCVAILFAGFLNEAALGQDVAPAYIELLKRPSVRVELGMTPEQVEEVNRLALQKLVVVASTEPGLSQLEPAERREAGTQLQQKLAKAEMDAYSLLVPAQQRRLNQIHNQSIFRASAPDAGLTHRDAVQALGLTEQDLQRIKEKAAATDAKLRERLDALREEMKKARDEARNEVLSLLSPAQLKQYEKLLGEMIDLHEAK